MSTVLDHVLLPAAWYKVAIEDAVNAYGVDEDMAAVLEVTGGPIRNAFTAWANAQPELTPGELGLGVPDVRAAREMVGLSASDFEDIFEAHPVAQDALEMGWIPITVATLLRLSARLGWPLGAFFRNAEGQPHRLTALSRDLEYWRSIRKARPIRGQA